MKTINSKSRPYEEPAADLVDVWVSSILCTSVTGSIVDEVGLEEYGEL